MPNSMDDLIAQICIGGFSVTLTLFICLCAVIIVFDGKATPTSKSNVKNAFNIHLCVMIVANMGIFASQYGFSIYTRNDKAPFICGVVTKLFLAAAESSYIFYSWHRSSLVLKAMLPKYVSNVGILVRVAPVVFFLQPIPDLARAIMSSQPGPLEVKKTDIVFVASSAVMGASALIAIAFDAILLRTFTRYLRISFGAQDRKQEGGTSKSFLIISRFGCAAIVLKVSCLIVFGYATLLASEEAYYLYITIAYSLLTIVWLVLFLMKISLLFQKHMHATSEVVIN
ncbi:hypothetical protein BC830DRAFT_1167737, partial [Chytriomyces sp. MP71]